MVNNQTSIQDRFRFVDLRGRLSREQIEMILERFPMKYYTVRRDVPADRVAEEAGYFVKEGIMEVSHGSRVIYLNPPEGMKLAKAVTTDMNFPFRPDNLLDDHIGLRCCFHPRLTSFGLPVIDKWDEIEIDVYKFPASDRYGMKGEQDGR